MAGLSQEMVPRNGLLIAKKEVHIELPRMGRLRLFLEPEFILSIDFSSETILLCSRFLGPIFRTLDPQS